jgi:hypothetical protein
MQAIVADAPSATATATAHWIRKLYGRNTCLLTNKLEKLNVQVLSIRKLSKKGGSTRRCQRRRGRWIVRRSRDFGVEVRWFCRRVNSSMLWSDYYSSNHVACVSVLSGGQLFRSSICHYYILLVRMIYKCPDGLNLSIMVHYFSFIINQPTILSVMAY